MLARRPLTDRLYGWLSYTLSNNLRSFGGGAVGPSDWDQRHVFNLVAGYRGAATRSAAAPTSTPDGPSSTSTSPAPSSSAYLPSTRSICGSIATSVYDKFLLDVYAELVNATLSQQVTSLTQDSPGMPPREDSFRVVLPSIGIHGEL